MSPVHKVKAQYTKRGLNAFDGNPLIEALPPIREPREWAKVLYQCPRVSVNETNLPPTLRKITLLELESFHIPRESTLELAQHVETALYRGYSTKIPGSPTFTHYEHYLDVNETIAAPSTGRFISRPTGITLVGDSGTGKTWMIESILNQNPQIIEHEEYKGLPLERTQVVWLKLDCPQDGSVKSLLLSFLSQIDLVLGTTFFEEAKKLRITRPNAKDQIDHLCRRYCVGLIVLDEFSNLKVPKNSSADNVPDLLTTVLNLMNSTGVPIVFCGNREMLDVLTLTEKTGRRAGNGGFVESKPFSRKEWTAMSKRLWRSQYTQPATPWSEDLANTIFDYSDGIIDYAKRAFIIAQRKIIGTSDERLTQAILMEACKEAVLMAKRGRQNQPFAVTFTHPTQASEKSSPAQATRKPRIRKKPTVSLDPQRTLHPEFKDSIENLRYSSPVIPEDVQQSTLRKSTQTDDPLGYLQEHKLVITTPLDLSSLVKGDNR